MFTLLYTTAAENQSYELLTDNTNNSVLYNTQNKCPHRTKGPRPGEDLFRAENKKEMLRIYTAQPT